ncbi:uncharacterized protein LOC144638857 isoform X2 [Oculina patagonica]
MEALNEAAKKLEHVHFSKTLKLNVGGHLFSTSLATMTKDPGSMLHAMFSGRFDTKPSEDGSYFIDRDGTHFRYILNYLRTGQLIVPEDKTVRKELLAEAEFYQVQGIINELTARPFKLDSVIVPYASDQRQILINWLMDTRPLTTANSFPFLLYRASRDGWTGAQFHSCCDNKGPTMIVVSGCILNSIGPSSDTFGGYTEERWEGASEITIERQDTFDIVLQAAHNGKPQHMYRIYSRDFVCVIAPKDSKNCSISLSNRKYVSKNEATSGYALNEIEVFGFEK